MVVRDHGPGIPEADLPHVFTRFYRSPEARSKPGSGLGLSIVDQTARAHEGSVTVVNAPDGGAVFTFALPEAPPPPPPRGLRPAARRPGRRGGASAGL